MACGQVIADTDWRALTDAQDVVSVYPKQVESLIQGLDLDRPGLAPVRKAWENGRKGNACAALLDYYRDNDNMNWLRDRHVRKNARVLERADEILRDIYHGFADKGRIPRTENGHLDWDHTGANDDWQFVARVNRHAHLSTLLRAYLATDKDKYIQRLDRDLRDWLTAAHGRVAPWGTSHLEPANRMPVWSRVFYALQDDSGFRPATRLLMLAAIHKHAEYLLEHPGGGNWVTMTQYGALTCAIAWPEFEHAARWRRQAIKTLCENARNTVYPDGAQKELTAHYHMVALSRYERAADLLRRSDQDFPGQFAKRMERMWDYTAYSLRPDGTRPLNNDSDLGSEKRDLVRAASDYKRSDWRYIATNGGQGEKPGGPASVFFPWAGQLISRNGWHEDAHWSFFDIGPWGYGHQHNDFGHLSVTAFGRDILVDAGRFAYQGTMAQKFRNSYARHTRGHNTVLVDGQGQNNGQRVADNPALMHTVRDTFDFALGRFSRGFESSDRPDTRHTRATVYLRGAGWLVIDAMRLPGEHTINPLWHFHPECTVRTNGQSVLSDDTGKGNVRITPVPRNQDWSLQTVKGREQPHPQGWYSPDYGKAIPAQCAVYERTVNNNALFGWVITPGQNTPASPQVEWLDAPENVARVKIKWPDQPERTFTVVMDETALPLKLPDGRRLTARLLVEEPGREPRVACGALETANGELLAHDPVPTEQALAHAARELVLNPVARGDRFFIWEIPVINAYLRRPLTVGLAVDPNHGTGWQVTCSPAEITLEPGTRQTVEVRAQADPARPRYPLPELTVTFSVPSQDEPQPLRHAVTKSLPVIGSRPRVAAAKTPQQPDVDGLLDDAPWKGKPMVPALGRMDRGERGELHTAVWTAYDHHALYVAYRCEEPRTDHLNLDGGPDAKSLYRDDSVELFIDVHGRQEDYHHFIVNAAGTTYASFHQPQNRGDNRITTAVAVGDGSWTAELAIPWTVLGLDSPPQETAVLFARNRKAGGEHTVYQFPLSPGTNHRTSHFAKLVLDRE